ncbi:MAG TPA: NlpC/P60 family protein [Gaiellaceae bacterium]|nr:NlpC/P60 family protein [Gaiellaceae bacterium]
MTNRPLPGGRLSGLLPPSGSTRRKAPALVIAFAAFFAATAVSATADSVSSKQAEARSVLAQIQQLDSSLERAIEAYDLANVKLQQIKHDLTTNTHDLVIAKRSLKAAQRELSARLVELYTSQDQDSTLAVLLGSTSLDQMLSRIDASDRVGQQDALVLNQVTDLRREVQHREHVLKRAHAEQTQVVAQRAAAKASIQSQLGERRALLSSIHSEIAHLQAEERARQAELLREAQARQQSASTSVLVQTVGGVGTGTAPPPPTHGGVVGYAESQLGVPYVWGGASPSTGFDCSGLVMWAFAQIGVSLPHNAAAQYGYGSYVPRSDLQPGDLVFFNNLGHVGIYIGGNQFVEAPHTGDVVKISSISGWYASTYYGARRI